MSHFTNLGSVLWAGLLAALGIAGKFAVLAAVGAYLGFCAALFWESAGAGYRLLAHLLPWAN